MSTTLDFPYTCYTNVDGRFDGIYVQGDRLVRGHRGTITVPRGTSFAEAAERVFAIHNADDRPDGQLCPSMSVGDVVVFGESALSVSEVGFRTVTLDPDDLITDLTWREVMGR